MPRLWAEAGNTVEMGECGGAWFFVKCRERWLFWAFARVDVDGKWSW